MAKWRNRGFDEWILVSASGEILAHVKYRLRAWWFGFREFEDEDSAKAYAEENCS
jgi:hypothetical protein